MKFCRASNILLHMGIHQLFRCLSFAYRGRLVYAYLEITRKDFLHRQSYGLFVHNFVKQMVIAYPSRLETQNTS
jgi:hypothetical protein